jgi:hypothetical protein
MFDRRKRTRILTPPMQPITSFLFNMQSGDPVCVAVLFSMVARTEMEEETGGKSPPGHVRRMVPGLTISTGELSRAIAELVKLGELEEIPDPSGGVTYRVVRYDDLKTSIARHGRKLYNRMAQQKRRTKG